MLVVLLADAPTGAVKTKINRQPRLKRGPLASQRALEEGDPRGSVLGSRALRLSVHHVNDATNFLYIKEVRLFLEGVLASRPAFETDAEQDWVMACELEHRCYLEQLPLARGAMLYHGFMHVFPEKRGRYPLALRALHTWEDLQASAEGGPCCRESVHAMAEEMMKQKFVDAALASEVALDAYLREQDWDQLLAEDIAVDWRSPASP